MKKVLNMDNIFIEGQKLAEQLCKKHKSSQGVSHNGVDLDDQYNYLHYYDIEDNQWLIKEK